MGSLNGHAIATTKSPARIFNCECGGASCCCNILLATQPTLSNLFESPQAANPAVISKDFNLVNTVAELCG